MTKYELTRLIHKQGYLARIEEDTGTGYVHIISKEKLPQHVLDVIEAYRPVDVTFTFIVESRVTTPLPKVLEKWAMATVKEIKKD